MYHDNDLTTGTSAVESNKQHLAEAPAMQGPQFAIEEKMAESVRSGNYEAAYLFSDEGLPIAQSSSPAQQSIAPDQIAEMAILFQDVRRMASLMGGISRLREVIIEGENRRKIVFRFFRAFDQQIILAVVVPPTTKAYRQRTNELEKLVLEVTS